jgi:hypothetical protein
MSPPDAVGEQPWPWGESDTRCQFAGGRGTSRAKCRSPRVPFASGRYRTRMCGNPDARHGRAVRQFPIYNRAVVNWTNPAKLSQTPQCGRSSRHAWPRSARPQTRSRSLKMADDRLRRLARRCGLCPLHEPLARPRRAGHHHHLQWRRKFTPHRERLRRSRRPGCGPRRGGSRLGPCASLLGWRQ